MTILRNVSTQWILLSEVTVAEETVAEAAEAANEEVEAAKPARRSRSRKKKVE